MEGRIRQLESLLEHAEIIAAPEPGVVGPGHDRHDRLRGRQRRRRRALPRRPHRGAHRRPRRRQPDRAARRRPDRRPGRRHGRLRGADRRSCGCGSSRWRRPDRRVTARRRRAARSTSLDDAPRRRRRPPPLPGRGATSSCPAARVLLRELPGPPGAPTVVLLHGWTATADLNFFTCYEPLGEHFRVLAFDHRGHGTGSAARRRSGSRTAPTTWPRWSTRSGSTGSIAVGYSMGGAIAQLVWRRHPEACAGWCWPRRRPIQRPPQRAPVVPRPHGLAALARLTPAQARRWLTHAALPPAQDRARGRRGRSSRPPATTGGWCSRPAGRSARSAPTTGSARSTCRRRSSSRCRRRGAGAPPDPAVRGDPDGARAFRIDAGHDAVVARPERFVPTLLEACADVARHRAACERPLTAAAAVVGARRGRSSAVRRGGCVAVSARTRRRAASGPINRTSRAGRNLELARLGVAVGSTYAAHGGPQAVRLRRAPGRARRRAPAAHRRAGRRAARQHEGRADEGRPDGQLPRRRPARAGAPGARRAAGRRPADVGRAGRRGRRARARPPARASCSSSGTPSRSPRRRSARSTGPSPSTRPPARSGRWRSRSSTRASPRRSRPTCQHRPARHAAEAGLRRARPDGDGRRDQGARRPRSSTTGTRRANQHASPTSTAATRSSTSRPCCRRCRPAGC